MDRLGGRGAVRRRRRADRGLAGLASARRGCRPWRPCRRRRSSGAGPGFWQIADRHRLPGRGRRGCSSVRDDMNPLFALVCAILLPQVAVVGLVCFGRVLFPLLAGLAGRTVRPPRRHRAPRPRTPARVGTGARRARGADPGDLGDRRLDDPGAQLHRGLDRRAGPRPAEDSAGGGDRRRPGGRRDPRRRDRSTTSSTRAGPPTYGWMGPPRPSKWSTCPPWNGRAGCARSAATSATSASAHAVAVTETYAFDQAVGVGDRVRMEIDGDRVRPRVVAVVPDAPDLYAELLVSAAMVAERAHDAVPELVFVDPADGIDVPAVARGHGRESADRGQLDRRGGGANPRRQQPRPLGAARPGRALRRHRDRQRSADRRLPTADPAADDRAARRHRHRSGGGWRCGRPAWSVWPRSSPGRR